MAHFLQNFVSFLLDIISIPHIGHLIIICSFGFGLFLFFMFFLLISEHSFEQVFHLQTCISLKFLISNLLPHIIQFLIIIIFHDAVRDIPYKAPLGSPRQTVPRHHPAARRDALPE